MSISIDLSNRFAIVTGGTRGIGKSIVKKFILSGAQVIATGRNKSNIELLNDKNKNPNLKYVYLDLALDKSLNNFLKEISEIKKIDILINNAGINIISEGINVRDDDYELIQKVNVSSPFKISKKVGAKMILNKSGKIVNIASIWGVVTKSQRSSYSTSKFALIGFSKTFAVEWAKYNVLVNTVSPGFTLTDLTLTTNTSDEIKEIEKSIPQKRMAKTDDIANAVLFLVSDLNQYITGQNIIIDGGYTQI
tara:strand:+ start:1416 stop:2165 length:750 start_codon:yes stop_codon:yes gene_type:complete